MASINKHHLVLKMKLFRNLKKYLNKNLVMNGTREKNLKKKPLNINYCNNQLQKNHKI